MQNGIEIMGKKKSRKKETVRMRRKKKNSKRIREFLIQFAINSVIFVGERVAEY